MSHIQINWRMVNAILRKPSEIILGRMIVPSAYSICIPLDQMPDHLVLRDWLFNNFGSDYQLLGCGSGSITGIAIGFLSQLDLSIFTDCWII